MMNVVILSPHFPPNYYNFCVQLRWLGVTVLGIADEPYDLLRPELREALTEYYRVDDMHNYDQLLRGCGYFTHRYGKIDRFESHNEYWLETDARIRTDFNIYGVKDDGIQDIRFKSRMKERFQEAGVATAQWQIVTSPAQARRFAAKVGYPVVANLTQAWGLPPRSRSTATRSYRPSSRKSPMCRTSWRSSFQGRFAPSTD